MKKERRRAREIALEILYQKEIVGCSFSESIAMRELRLEEDSAEMPEYALKILTYIENNSVEIDDLIRSYADNWVLERMPVVDRSILRLGISEILFQEDVPYSVSINEAVELAKIYSTTESGKFVNGILGKIARDIEAKSDKKPEGVK